MRKSGLQKQISSIFNEAPIPVTDAEPTLPPQTAPVEPADTVEEAQTPPQTAVTDAPKPSLAQRMAEAPTEAIHTPAAPAMRPRPLNRTQSSSRAKAAAQKSGHLKKTITGSSSGKMDAHQKKMTVMVGVLSLVFATVLFVSLGGLGQSEATAGGNTDTEQTSQTVVDDQTPLQWHSPQPLPETLRNPMKTAPKTVAAEVSDDEPTGELVVKGIVFSKTRPTAIVNEKIVAQGETIDGTTVVTISKESVEFEKDGKRWTQSVQR